MLSPVADLGAEERIRYLVGQGGQGGEAPGDPWLKEQLPPYLDIEDSPLPHLSGGTKAVINALRNRIGGATAAKAAELSGLSYSQTCKVLADLERRGIATREKRSLGYGDGLHAKTVWSLSWADACHRVIDFLRFRKTSQAPDAPDTVPRRFWWHFWSGTHGSQLRVSEHGIHIASTLIGGRDVCARLWALRNMPDEVLAQCLGMRGLDTGEVSEMIAGELARRKAAA
ncbi:hypothetical protein [Candidatus Poriferisocius sp.]|uniref:hypothetical protein n=1 Tax=Candidatus Poriferisocius sp. TaxID=3101276 RepID=UPI003B5CF54E